MLNVLYVLLFLGGVYYLIKHRNNVKNAVDLSKQAVYPTTKDEYSSILIPGEWKEMEPISQNARSYQMVKWGTAAAFIMMLGLMWMVFFTDWLEFSFLNLVYMVLIVMNLVKHRGNLFILQSGIVLDGIFYPFKNIKEYEIERITLPHPLYGLHSRLNMSYKLSIRRKNKFSQDHYVVIEDQEHLNRMTDLLDQQGIKGKTNQIHAAVKDITSHQ
ncbi:hypothetical protein [Bacillus sp. FJAT-42376]|uniref:hypothetical protein n=1 Tax=Bacillus sp. FJAT-42376 TaxID=2014076 RepID=UPI000F4D3CFD|nr:hypothetical protein [Bacillus sp. FJAT-42376]